MSETLELDFVRQTLCDASQLFAGWKETSATGEWSEWDEDVYVRVQRLLADARTWKQSAAYADLAAVAREILRRWCKPGRMSTENDRVLVGCIGIDRLRAALERVDKAERGTT